jgi:hypothetical protein
MVSNYPLCLNKATRKMFRTKCSARYLAASCFDAESLNLIRAKTLDARLGNAVLPQLASSKRAAAKQPFTMVARYRLHLGARRYTTL